MMIRYPAISGILIILLICAAALAGMGGCKMGREAYAQPADFVDLRLVEANTEFAFKLFLALSGQTPGKNIFISPASVSLALAMTYNGAAGNTATAMAEVLKFKDMSLEEVNSAFSDLRTILENPDPRVELSVANSLWVRQGVNFYEDFLQRNRKFYKAKVEELDFDHPGAAGMVNRWVEKQTNHKIKELITPPIHPLTVMFLINALYFKAEWTESFDPKLTRQIPFQLPGGNQKQHPLMFQEGEYLYLDTDGFQAVSLPYGKNGRISMYIFLPHPGETLETFNKRLTLTNWNSWMKSFQKTEGKVGLPRFKFEYESSLNQVLKGLGMEIAFDAAGADFSAMRPVPPGLFIAEVKHKTFVEVNEKGTEAAGATSVEMRLVSINPDRFNLVVDRPFFFSIVDNKTGSILFMGSLTEPVQ